MSSAIAEISESIRKRREPAVRQFRAVAKLIAAGEVMPVEAIERVLDAASASLAELEAAVTLYERRIALAARLEQREVTFSKFAILTEEISKAESHLERLRAELSETRNELDASDDAGYQLQIIETWERGEADGPTAVAALPLFHDLTPLEKS